MISTVFITFENAWASVISDIWVTGDNAVSGKQLTQLLKLYETNIPNFKK